MSSISQTHQRFSIDLDSILAVDKTYLTHNYHPYPAKYIPQIPSRIMDFFNLQPGSVILDPFCGSGTTLVEASLRGIKSIGIDANQIACLASRAKTTLLSRDALDELMSFRAHVAELARPAYKRIDTPLLEFKNRDHWFAPNMIAELSILRAAVDGLVDTCARDFARTALSAIVVKCSNQESDTRWVAVKKSLPDGYGLDAYCRKLDDMLARMREYSKRAPAKASVYCHDSRDLSFLADASVDCVISSPPYLNSFDYYLYHKLRMFILGYDHYKAQDTEIGSRNRHCDKGEGWEVYIDSMRYVFKELFRVLRPKGFMAIVIGDSVARGEVLHMDRHYRELISEFPALEIDVFSFSQRKYTSSFTKNLKTQTKLSHIMLFQKSI